MKMKVITLLFFLSVCIGAEAQKLIKKSENGKWGFKKEKSKAWIIQPQFQQVEDFGAMGLAPTLAFASSQEGRWGVIGQDGQWKASPVYDHIFQIDMQGIVFPAAYRSVFREQVILNEQGLPQSPTFTSYFNFKNDFVLFENTVRSGKSLYQIKDKKLIPTSLVDCERIDIQLQNTLFFKKSKMMGYYKMAQEPMEISGFDIEPIDGITTKNKQIIFVDLKNFRVDVLSNYDEIQKVPYQEYEVWLVKHKGKMGVFNFMGKQIIPVVYDEVKVVGEYLLAKEGSKSTLFYYMSEKKLVFDDFGVFDLAQVRRIYFIKRGNKYYLLKSRYYDQRDLQDLPLSEAYDKVELQELSKSGRGAKYYLVAYKKSQKFYINDDTYEASTKPHLISISEGTVKYTDMMTRAGGMYEDDDNARAVLNESGVFAPAQFPAGMSYFDKVLQAQLSYPAEALKNKKQGVVRLSFVISQEGAIEKIEIVEDIGDGCGAAAVKAVRSIRERWTPARDEKGKAIKMKKEVNVQFKMP